MPQSFADFEKAAVAGKFTPGYLLVGSELFFRDRARELMRKQYGLAEHDLAETPVRDALDDAASLDLFGGLRLVWLRNAEALLGRRRASSDDDDDGVQTASKHSPDAIAAYFNRPQPASVVVFEATFLDLSDRDDLRRCERLEKLLPVTSVRLERPTTGQAARYLLDEARQRDVTLDEDAARDLAEACAGDLARARQELEKLMLFAADRRRIALADIQAMVPAEASFTLWEISDAIGERDTARALRLVRDMLQQDTPALLLNTLIAGQVRKLLKCKEGAGKWVHPRVKEQARKFSVAELASALGKIYEADVALRSSPPEERVVLERLVLELARLAENSQAPRKP